MISGAQPATFQGRGGLMELEHFDKHFVKNTKEKRSRREKVFKKSGHLFSIFKIQNTLYQNDEASHHETFKIKEHN